jgi:hypothetical protein
MLWLNLMALCGGGQGEVSGTVGQNPQTDTQPAENETVESKTTTKKKIKK